MATTTFFDYTGDGSDKTFDYSFPTFAQTDVVVELDGVIVDNYTIPGYATSGTKTVTFDNTTGTLNSTYCESSGAPKSGVAVRVYRDTGVDSAKATYTAGTSVKSDDLNNNQTQVLRALQEEQNQTITASKIRDGAITSAKILDGTILTADIKADNITSALIADDQIDSEHIAAGAVDLEHMSANSVDSDQYVDGSIDLAHMSANSVSSDQYVDNSILTAHIGTGQVTTDQIAASTIVDADISGSAAIAGSKISPDFGSQDIITAGHVDIGDASQVKIGAGDDLLLYHDNTTGHSFIKEVGTNELKIASNSIGVQDPDATKTSAKFTPAGSVDLFYNDSKKIETTNTGVTVTGKTTTTTLNIGGTDVTSTGTELNFVDGVTSNVQTQLDAKQAADAELTELATMASDTASALADLTNTEVAILDGATVSTAELNILDGVTADKDDLNQIDGLTKQTGTSLSDTDSSFPTSKAVVNYVTTALEPFGGFELAANKTSFPNAQPPVGVVISITDANGIEFDNTDPPDSVTGNCKTAGNTNVTIQAAPDALKGKTIGSGVGMLVSSTGSGQNYTFHRLLAKDADVEELSQDIQDFKNRYRVASSAPSSDNDEGDLYFDTAANKMYVYDGSSWGEVTSTGDFKYLTLCAFNTGTGNAAVFNGSISKYDLRENSTSGSLASVTNAAQLMVSVNGVVQKPNTGTSIGSNDGFCMVDGHTIEFGANIPSNSEVFVVQSGSALAINVVGDGTVTEAKLNANAPTNGHVLTADSTAAGGFKWATTEASSITTQGDILYRGASENERLAAGTSGYYLKTQGSGANPVWAAVSQYSTPLTTRGDILFRDASGDQRLAKGTAGQYLKIGANDPEWADVVGAVANGCIFENDQTISDDYTIASGKGAHSVGPITVNATVTVNGNWVVS